jgi:pyrroline-5-carboxylate reductase
MKLGFVGGGVMAEAIVSGALKEGVALAGEIVVSDIVEARRSYLESTYGIATVGNNEAATKGADIVILAVKPQNLAQVLDGIRGALAEPQTVLSIVAGAQICTIAEGLDYRSVVRAMPNTPAQLGQGITAWTATAEVSSARREEAKHVLSALGREVYMEDEKLIDIATAISGSGPAYVFLFIEALIEAGVFLGMSRDVAHQLAVHTVAGSGIMAAQTGDNLAVLRERVTSPGGTTAEALLALEEGNFRATVMNAVIAAYEKAKELGAKS